MIVIQHSIGLLSPALKINVFAVSGYFPYTSSLQSTVCNSYLVITHYSTDVTVQVNFLLNHLSHRNPNTSWNFVI